MARNVPQELARLAADVKAIKKGQRYAHGGSIEDSSLEVRDNSGSLRGIIGVQADGTTAVNIVNGAAPPTPSTPTVAPALGGVAVGWDGTLADGSVLPMDWARVEVHTSTTAGFTPSSETLQATIETPQGGICYIPATSPTYACLLARNTSGTASDPTPVVGPYSPKPVAGEIGIGEITATMISDGAITTPKLFANAVTTPKLSAGAVDATALAADAITGKVITGGQVNGAVITGGTLQTGTSGEHITLNELGQNKILVYDSTGTAIGELSSQGLLVKGTNGAILWLNPNATYPQLRLNNPTGTNSAIVQLDAGNTGDANLITVGGRFTSDGFTDMCWRTWLGTDGYAVERVRFSNTSTIVGSRISMTSTVAQIGYWNTTDATQNTSLQVQAGLGTLLGGRLQVLPPASANSAFYVEAAAAHTGNLARLFRNGVDYFKVDKDGNTTVTGVLTAGNIATGTISITPSAASVPTSASVSFPPLTGTTFRGYATASTTVPGVRTPVGAQGVTGVSVSSVTSSSALIWVNRENTTATTINWMVIGS